MGTLERIASVFALSALLAGCASGPTPIEGDGLLVLEGATLVPGDGGPVVRDSALVLRGDRIARVGGRGDFAYPPTTEVVDVRGAWIVPGYFDTHVHLLDVESVDEALRQLLANGVTTVRVAAGLGADNAALREEIESGARLAPRIRTAGMPIDEPDGPFEWMSRVATAEEMRAEVRRQAAEGVDYVKLYRTVRPELAQVAVDEAHAHGLRVIGHLNLTTWAQAAAMGMDGVVHSGIYSPMWELLPEDQWETVRTTFNDFGRDGVIEGFELLTEGLDVESPEFRRWARNLRESDLPVEPNLVMQKAVFWGDDEALYRSFEPENAPTAWQGTYRIAFPRSTVAQVTPEWMEAGRALYPLLEDQAVALFRAGVTVTAGTDMMLPWMTPGTSLHRELQLLGEAGLTPTEVLRVATLNGAVAMGLDAELGTIAEGKVADLVVLEADPLESVHHLRDIRLVVSRGRVRTPAEVLAD